MLRRCRRRTRGRATLGRRTRVVCTTRRRQAFHPASLRLFVFLQAERCASTPCALCTRLARPFARLGTRCRCPEVRATSTPSKRGTSTQSRRETIVPRRREASRVYFYFYFYLHLYLSSAKTTSCWHAASPPPRGYHQGIHDTASWQEARGGGGPSSKDVAVSWSPAVSVSHKSPPCSNARDANSNSSFQPGMTERFRGFVTSQMEFAAYFRGTSGLQRSPKGKV